MKAILKVTNEEGKKMLEELKNVALEFGWEEEDLANCSILQEYGRAIDRALAVLNFEIDIEEESSDDEDEEYDFDDEDELEDCEDYDGEDDEPSDAEFFLDLIEKGYSVEAAQAITDFLFGKCENEDE